MGRLNIGLCALGVIAALAGIATGQVPEQFRVRGAQAKPHPYLAAAGLDTPATVQVKATDAEKRLGFGVFSKPITTLIKPDFVPDQADRCTALAAADCPGQYGCLSFGLFAIEAGEFTAEVGDLLSPAGQRIGRENFEMRMVRPCKVTYKGKPETIPLLLERLEKKAVPAGRLQQFWITYFLPPTTSPGLYQGEVVVRAGPERRLAIPLRLEVYPFNLVEPQTSLYIYYNHSTPPDTAGLIAKELADQRCHGMNTTTLIPPVTESGELREPALVSLLDLCKQAGFTRPLHVDLWNRITCEWLNEPDRSIKMWGPWFRYYPFTDRLDARYVAAVKTLHEQAKSRGLDVMVAVADEAGSHPWTTEGTQHYFDLLRQNLPEVTRELTVGGGWAMGRPEHDLWKGRINIWTTNRWLADKLELVRKNDASAKIGIYNMAGGGSSPGGIEPARIFYGYFAWKTQAHGAAQWAYYHDATPEDNYTWPSSDPREGHVPTLRWEVAREGVKDYRYLATLQQKLSGKTGPAAQEANRLLGEIDAAIELRTMDYDPITGGRIPVPAPGLADKWRHRAAKLIIQLEQQ